MPEEIFFHFSKSDMIKDLPEDYLRTNSLDARVTE